MAKRSGTFRAICSGDLHVDASSERFPECQRVLGWIVDLVQREKPDAFLCPGDIYERASVPVEREQVADVVTPIADVCPIVVTKGNHDEPLDCLFLSRLRAKHRITVVERASVERVGPAALACVAWPNRSAIAAMIGTPLPAEAIDDVAREALRNVFRALRDALATCDGPRIALGHFMVDGSIVSTGQPLVGKPLNVGLSDLALLGASAVVMGHIHKPQEWTLEDMVAFYTGSPFRKTYGELEEKSVTLLEYQGAKLVRRERLPTPASPMIHLEGKFAQDSTGQWHLMTRRPGDRDWGLGAGLPGWTCAELVGAEVRFRYTVPLEYREAAAGQAAEFKRLALEYGKAKSVKVEEQLVVVQRSRLEQLVAENQPAPAEGQEPELDEAFDHDPAPALHSVQALGDKLNLVWRAKHYDPGARRDPIKSKLEQLEQENPQ